MKYVEFKDTENTFLIPAAEYLAVAHAVAKKQHRPQLCGVYIEKGENVPQITATNGHMLLSVACSSGSVYSHSGEKGLILDVNVGEKAFKAKPCFAGEKIWMYFNLDEMTVQFLSIDDEPIDGYAYPRAGICEFGLIDAEFPDWRRVVPIEPHEDDEKDKSYISIRFNADYITAFAKAHKCLIHNMETSLQFICTASDTAVKVKFSDVENMIGVIMPKRA